MNNEYFRELASFITSSVLLYYDLNPNVYPNSSQILHTIIKKRLYWLAKKAAIVEFIHLTFHYPKTIIRKIPLKNLLAVKFPLKPFSRAYLALHDIPFLISKTKEIAMATSAADLGDLQTK